MNLKKLVEEINIKPDEKKTEALNTYIQNNRRSASFDKTLKNAMQRDIIHTFYKEDYYNHYNYVYEELDGLDYTIADIDKVANSPKYRGADHDTNTSTIFGLALSALMNKVAEKGDKIQLNMPMSIYYLFYLADGIEAHVNVAGGYLGNSAKNSKIYAEKAANVAGQYMDNCELHVNEAGNYLGNSAKNSKIYAEKAWSNAGYCMDNCELHVNAAGDYLGDSAKNSKIYAEKAGDYTGDNMNNCELHVNVAGYNLGYNAKNSKIYAGNAGFWAGNEMYNCELHVNLAGDYLGKSAKNSKIYAENAGNHAGYNMDNCELYIKNLIGELDGSCFKGKNEIYLGKESYELHPIKYRLRKVKIWEKET